MAYRFKLNEPIAEAASRIGLEQIDSAEARLASRDDDAAAVHDARRCLKRLRALLRLMRPALPDSTYRREAIRLADIGRLLAGARDQHVMQQTLVRLESRFGPLPNGAGSKLVKLMANGSGIAHGGTKERQDAIAALEQARTFFTHLARRPISFEHIAAGIERSYRRARRAFREAYEVPTGENFHEWRKAVQQHWRHMQLVARAWPDVLGGRATEAKELSRLLGDDHDFEVFLVFASTRGKPALSERDLETLRKTCRTVQEELRTQAKPRGTRLFSDKPASMCRKVESYWAAACRLAELAPTAEADDGKRRGKIVKKKPAPRRPVRQAASRGTRSEVRGSGR